MPKLALFVCLCLLATPAWGQRVAPADKPLVVRLQAGKPTSVEFPEPIKDVGVIERPDLFSINTSGPYLYLYPFAADLDERLFVVDMKGKQYQVDLKVGSPSDVTVRLSVPVAQPVQQVRVFDDASILRYLRFGKPIPGWGPMELPLPQVPDPRVAIIGNVTIGQGERFGQTLTLRNLTDEPLTIDPRAGESVHSDEALGLGGWGWPPRLDIKAITAFPTVLPPGGEGLLYIVYAKRSAP